MEPVLAEGTLQHGAGHGAATYAVLGLTLILLFLDVLHTQLSHHFDLQLLSALVCCHLVAHIVILNNFIYTLDFEVTLRSVVFTGSNAIQ